MKLAAIAFASMLALSARSGVTVEPSRSEIVATASAQEAAEELSCHFGLITGTRIPVVAVPTAGAYVWHVGEAPADAAAAANPEEAHWRIGRDAAWFYGGACNGARHAVMDFLEEALGVRWPFGTNVFYTAMSPLRLAKTSGDWVPALLVRKIRPDVRPTTADNPTTRTWAVRMREGEHHEPQYGHAFVNYWEKHAKGHPDFFAQRPDGKRMPFDGAYRGEAVPDNPALAAGMSGAPYRRIAMCPSSRGLRREVVRQWLADGTNAWINLCENDAYGAWSCTCETCRALDEQPVAGHFYEKEPVWYADRYVAFANAVLAAARKVRPDVKATMYAYFGTQEAPRRERPDAALVVGLVPVDFTDEGIAAYVGNWKRAGLRTFFYRPNRHWYFRAPDTPLGCEEHFFNVWKYLHSQGAIGFDYDSPGNVSAFEWFRDYVIAKAMQDPSKDFAYWEDHYMQAFGAAAEDVKAYFRHWRRDVWDGRIVPDFGRYEGVLRRGVRGGYFFRQLQCDLERYYHADDFGRTEAMLAAGLARAGLTEPARRNLEALFADHRRAADRFRRWGSGIPVKGYAWSNHLPDDATAMTRSALASDAKRIIFEKCEKDWVVEPVAVGRSDLEILVDPGVVIRTKDGCTDLDRIFRLAPNARNVRIVRK